VRFHQGDFFNDSLPGADVLVMGMLLHDWNLDEKKTLLKKAYDGRTAARSLLMST
jgi:hypothetical protein